MSKKEGLIQSALEVKNQLSAIELEEEIHNLQNRMNNIQKIQKEIQDLTSDRSALGDMQGSVSCSSPYQDKVICNNVNNNIRQKNDKRSALDKKIEDLLKHANDEHSISLKDSDIKAELESIKQEIQEKSELLTSYNSETSSIDILHDSGNEAEIISDGFEL